jgi:leucyl/phenylalanyl-tRNA---protein transferase
MLFAISHGNNMFPRSSKPRFPPAEQADERGIVLVGGQLDQESILEAYCSGIFPWPVGLGYGHVLAWFSPDPRAILEFENMHVSRRLLRRMRSGQFRVTCDTAFREVIYACALPRDGDGGTWITPGVKRAYMDLHTKGFAHSVEVWEEGKLVGGAYGLALGGYFSAESMFHRTTDASKIALVSLRKHLHTLGFTLFDVQVTSSHLLSMGATELPRKEFLKRLKTALQLPIQFKPEIQPKTSVIEEEEEPIAPCQIKELDTTELDLTDDLDIQLPPNTAEF